MEFVWARVFGDAVGAKVVGVIVAGITTAVGLIAEGIANGTSVGELEIIAIVILKFSKHDTEMR